MVAEEYEGVGGTRGDPLEQVIKRGKKREMFEDSEEDPFLLGRRGSRLPICIPSPTHLSQLFDRLERVQLDDDVGQELSSSKSRRSLDFSPNKSMDFPSRTSMDFSPTKSIDFSTSKSMDFIPSKNMDFSPSKSILKSSRERSRRKSVKFHFADEQTTV